MHQIRIPIHSFIDLITNSSSETYVSCTSKTVEAAQELIEALFNQAAHPGLKAKDFFTISIVGTAESDYQIQSLVIEPKDASDPKQVAVCAAIRKLVDSIEGQTVYN